MSIFIDGRQIGYVGSNGRDVYNNEGNLIGYTDGDRRNIYTDGKQVGYVGSNGRDIHHSDGKEAAYVSSDVSSRDTGAAFLLLAHNKV